MKNGKNSTKKNLTSQVVIDRNQNSSQNRNRTETRLLKLEPEPKPKFVLNQNRNRNRTEIKNLTVSFLQLEKKSHNIKNCFENYQTWEISRAVAWVYSSSVHFI
jgi:hypothetical protein